MFLVSYVAMLEDCALRMRGYGTWLLFHRIQPRTMKSGCYGMIWRIMIIMFFIMIIMISISSFERLFHCHDACCAMMALAFLLPMKFFQKR